MSDASITNDVLASDISPRFQENSTTAVKPNTLPLNEINLPSFRDISPFSTSPNNLTANDCATSSNFYQELNDKFGSLTVNDFHTDVQLRRLQQKQAILRPSQDSTDYTSSLLKSKVTSPDDMRHFVDHQQNHSPFKVVQTTSNSMSHRLQSPFYDQSQHALRSLVSDGQQFQTTYNSLPPYSSYATHDSLQQDLNSLSNYFASRGRVGENSLPQTSPTVDELKSLAKHLDGVSSDGEMAGNFGSSFMTAAGENENLKLVPPLKVSETHEGAMNNFSSNPHVNELLLLKLRQPNVLAAKQQQPMPLNLVDFNQYGLSKKEMMPRQNMPNLAEAERLTKLYLNELIRENPNLLTNHLLSTMPMPGLSLPINFHNNHVESYSRKVFIGGLPPDSDEDEITASFRQFGPLIVDWPHKAETKTNFPPKGYCFLLFQDEMSVQNLIEACIQDDAKYYWCITCSSQKDKPVRRVQIRPWCLVDSDFVMDGSQPLDLRKTIFVGGVPRPLRAVELALAMERLYGGVCYAGIDTDPELKYPKGAGRVSFSNQQSYIAAISARFVQLQLGDIDKRVEVKPYVLDDQLCDECQGQKCAGKSAPYFCANVACLQYYCEVCWVQIHSRPGREFHKPLVKEGADRPKSIPPFKW